MVVLRKCQTHFTTFCSLLELPTYFDVIFFWNSYIYAICNCFWWGFFSTSRIIASRSSKIKVVGRGHLGEVGSLCTLESWSVGWKLCGNHSCQQRWQLCSDDIYIYSTIYIASIYVKDMMDTSCYNHYRLWYYTYSFVFGTSYANSRLLCERCTD